MTAKTRTGTGAGTDRRVRLPLPVAGGNVAKGQPGRTREGIPVSARSTTRERILEVSRVLFNRRGYANTTMADIAAEAGIAVGNLTYHFPAKRELVRALEEGAKREARAIRAAYPSGRPVADDYVEAVLTSMEVHRAYLFLLRDYLQFSEDRTPLRLSSDLTANFDALRDLVDRMDQEGMFRRDLSVDLDAITRLLWLVGRYWPAHLQEHEGLVDVEWADIQRGFEHHLAVLLPCVTAAARRSLEGAFLRVSGEITARSPS